MAARHHFSGWDRLFLAELLVFNVGLGDELLQGLLPGRFHVMSEVLVKAAVGGPRIWTAATIVRDKITQPHPKAAT